MINPEKEIVDGEEIILEGDIPAEVIADVQKDKKGYKGKRNNDRNADGSEKKDSGYIEKVISIRRVTKVTKGGKNMNFTALVVVGDGKGKASYSLAKAPEVADAIRKALTKAKKKFYDIPVEKTTIPHDIIGEFSSHQVLLKPALTGTGIIACFPVRAVCEAAGISNILSKVLSKSSNPINIIKATFNGLMSMKTA